MFVHHHHGVNFALFCCAEVGALPAHCPWPPSRLEGSSLPDLLQQVVNDATVLHHFRSLRNLLTRRQLLSICLFLCCLTFQAFLLKNDPLYVFLKVTKVMDIVCPVTQVTFLAFSNSFKKFNKSRNSSSNLNFFTSWQKNSATVFILSVTLFKVTFMSSRVCLASYYSQTCIILKALVTSWLVYTYSQEGLQLCLQIISTFLRFVL